MHGLDRPDATHGTQQAARATVRRQETPNRAAAQAMTGGPPALSPGNLRLLQGAAGNAAVASVIKGRTGAEPAGAESGGQHNAAPSGQSSGAAARATALESGTGALAVGSDAAAMGGGATVGSQYLDPTFSTDSSYHTGMAGPFGAMIANGYGVATGVSTMHKAGRERQSAPAGSARGREADSAYNSAAADTAQNASGFVGQALGGAGGAMSFAGQNLATYNTVLAGGAGAGLPAGVIQLGRYIRKATHAQQRVEQLTKLMEQQGDPAAALSAANKEVEARKAVVAALESDLAALESEAGVLYQDIQEGYMSAAGPSSQSATDAENEEARRKKAAEWFDLESARSGMEARLTDARQQLGAARGRASERQAFSAAIEAALHEPAAEAVGLERDESQPLSLHMIQLYALQKNKHGYIKKIIAALGGGLSASASVATLVATIAVAAAGAGAGAVLIATPVGWALAGAAAATALGLASYKTWRFFAKRWLRTAEKSPAEGARATFKHLGKTLAFWQSTGPGERVKYATALYEFSVDKDAAKAEQAQLTLRALGLDRYGMPDDREAAIQLIARKMAS